MFKAGTPKVQQRDDKYAGPEDEKFQEKPKIKKVMKIPTLKVFFTLFMIIFYFKD